jgi:undecaprenyl-phosphate glucose phosphotransferase
MSVPSSISSILYLLLQGRVRNRQPPSFYVSAKLYSANVFIRCEYLTKTMIDKIAAIALIMLLLPVLILIAVLIICDSRGGAFYTQQRQGLRGKTFNIIKFRTMHAASCDDGAGDTIRQATANDPRVTRIGRILRRTSLDELPQLLNVLKGEMSIVGPRPHALAHDREYGRLIPGYARRYDVKPGITGLAQVKGLRGATPTLDLMAQRVELDFEYIASWSLWLDMRIVLRTLLCGFRHERAV